LPGQGGEALPSTGKEMPVRTVDTAQISEAVSSINKIVQNIQRDLSFNLDEDSGETIIQVVDSESGELIRQIPSEEALAIAIQLRDLQQDAVDRVEIGQGLLFSDST
jgi:flagellar protein FlaG